MGTNDDQGITFVATVSSVSSVVKGFFFSHLKSSAPPSSGPWKSRAP